MYFRNSHIFHNLINHSLTVTNGSLFYTCKLICDPLKRKNRSLLKDCELKGLVKMSAYLTSPASAASLSSLMIGPDGVGSGSGAGSGAGADVPTPTLPAPTLPAPTPCD